MRLLSVCIICCIAVFVRAASSAEPYPNKPVRLILSNAAGTNQSVAALTLRDGFAKRGVSVVVDAKPGASGLIAGDHVARSAPDGYTLLLTPSTYMSITPHVQKNMPFDPLRDLVPVIQLFRYPFVLAVGAASSVRTVHDLIALAKERPGKVTYGTLGVGGGQHLAGEMLARMAGVRMINIPYSPAAMQALIGDVTESRIDAAFSVTATVVPQVQSGKLRAIGVTGTNRSSLLPNVPAIHESMPGFSIDVWVGIYAPKGTSETVIGYLNAAISEVLEAVEIRRKMASRGEIFAPNTPKQVAEELRNEHARFGSLVRDIGLKPE